MKHKSMKMVYLGICVSLLCLVVPVHSTNNTYESEGSPLPATHTVLVEACTASFCSPCAVAAAYMHDIYESGQYDFNYVALVSDKNPYASQRCAELGVSGIPDYVFDGDYTRWVGSGGLPGAYTSRLTACEKRTVADVEFILDVTWLENGKLDVIVDLINIEETPYVGHLHAYVTEMESRWDTYSGQPYHFAMIGNYPLNQDVTVPAQDSLRYAVVWDGASYGFSDIQRDNIAVIVTVFDKTSGFVDDTASVLPRLAGDVTGDDVVDVLDLLEILAAWDETGDPGWIAADVTDDGVVDVLDLLEVLAYWS